MKNFQIIEEGRLDKQQMSWVMGGGTLNCESSGTTTFRQTGDTVICPIKYKSCERGNKLTCNLQGGYSGQPGGAGVIDSIQTDLIP